MIKFSKLSWINVSDFEKAKTFFTQTLGLQLKELHEQYNWMEVQAPDGGTILGIGCDNSEKPVIKAGGNAVMTFTVDDIDKAKQEFIKKNINVIGDILEVPGHVKLLFFTDLDGNVFQLVQEL